MPINAKSGFFNAIKESDGNYDRTYDASDFASYFSNFVSDGVFISPADQLKVSAKTGLTVTVKKGKAFVEGYWFELVEDCDITLPVNSGTQARTDIICVRLNKQNRVVELVTKSGVTSTLPTASGTVHELVLAEIVIGVSVTTLTAGNITDRRPDKNYCGFVGALVTDIDTTNLYNQFTNQFNTWFEELKKQFGSDVVGALQQSISDLTGRMDTAEMEISKRLKIKS
jgi:hypothetical protein